MELSTDLCSVVGFIASFCCLIAVSDQTEASLKPGERV